MKRIDDLLLSERPTLIVTHRRPDGDAVGAAMGLAAVLRANGRSAEVLLPDGFPAKYRPVAGENYLRAMPENPEARFGQGMILDTARPDMAAAGGMTPGELAGKIPCGVIDHHPDNGFGDGFIRETDAGAAAASLLVFELCRRAGLYVPPEAATLFFMGLSTDTGGFRFSNADARSFAVAGAMLAAGADMELVNRCAFFSKPVNQQRLEADLVLHHLEMRLGGALAVGRITAEMLEEYAFDMRDGEGVIERLRELEGVKAAVLISPRDGGLKISARTRAGTVSAAAVLREFGGGGHELAAGLQLDGPDAEAVKDRVLERFAEELEKR